MNSLFFCLLSFFLWFAVFSPSVRAEVQPFFQTDLPSADLLTDLPESFGKIIYRFNAVSPKQLYVIGVSHRSAFSGGDASTTVQAQSEVYRIGEWFKRNTNLELLLPEGFFNRKTGVTDIPIKKLAVNVDNFSQKKLLTLDDQTLEKRLSDHTSFINAEMLLMETLHMQAGQVEDRGLYDKVYSALVRLGTLNNDSQRYLSASSELHRLQKMRTAFILQKVPAVIDAKSRQGSMQKKQALLTIGLNHLKDIIRYINESKITVDSSSLGQEKYVSQLNIIKEGFGITIIVPQVLATDRRIREMTGLNNIHMASLQTADEP